jgi:two-component system response regulator AtoC
MNILIVDDEPAVADVLAQSLERQGHTTMTAHSGQEALRLLGTTVPDAMFLDISMPGMNGLDVLIEVRKGWPSLPVVVITGNATPEEIDQVHRLGVLDVITKPTALRNYHAALKRLA